ncbi:MAG TPA: carboxypeptidase regulatory-like domain-containing protein [Pyrinomonadaceae bacterium]|jgi:tetratricopeptide (TPR) repeat protein
MKFFISGLCVLLLVIVVSTLAAAPKNANLINRIEGQVYDPNHRPVENAYVELLSEFDSILGRTKTNSSGRFTFSGMPSGRFVVKVLPFGTNLLEQTQEVVITNLTRVANDTAYLEIILRYDKRSSEAAIEKNPGVIFVQEVPDAAKKRYTEGMADLEKHPEKGLAELEEAVSIFPNYFDALDSLGKEYVARKDYEKAYPYLLRAIDVNQRSYSTYYSLSYAFYQLKQYTAALEAAKATVFIVPGSMEGQLLYGTLLRINGSYTEAETALLKANLLAKKMNSEVHWQLSLLYNRLNRTQDTISELETFLKLEPDSPDKNKIRDMIARLKASANKTNH